MQYLEGTIKQLRYYEQLGTTTLERMTDEQLFAYPAPGSNSLAMIVKHMSGNMLSRWTDFRITDGEKSWRDRDGEFADDLTTRAAVMEAWQQGWKCFFDAILPIKDDELEELVYIRNQGHTIVEAINRQLAHYAYHVGQMVYVGRFFMKEDWESLSIPVGQSKDYNNTKFSAEKGRGHFTDEFLGDKGNG